MVRDAIALFLDVPSDSFDAVEPPDHHRITISRGTALTVGLDLLLDGTKKVPA